eukprot:5867835-Pleurochrysis_carterae.AAC.1
MNDSRAIMRACIIPDSMYPTACNNEADGKSKGRAGEISARAESGRRFQREWLKNLLLHEGHADEGLRLLPCRLIILKHKTMLWIKFFNTTIMLQVMYMYPRMFLKAVGCRCIHNASNHAAASIPVRLLRAAIFFQQQVLWRRWKMAGIARSTRNI